MSFSATELAVEAAAEIVRASTSCRVETDSGILIVRDPSGTIEHSLEGRGIDETGVPVPRSDAGDRPRRILIECSSSRSVRMATEVVAELAALRDQVLTATRNPSLHADEKWLGLGPREMIGLLSSTDIVVGVVDEWEEVDSVIQFAALGGLRVVVHGEARIPIDSGSIVRCEMWSGESFVAAIRRAFSIELEPFRIPDSLKPLIEQIGSR